MKEFSAVVLIGYIFQNAFTKSDHKDIDRYASNFINNAAIDFARDQHQEDLNLLFQQISGCSHDFQIKSAIRHADLSLKYFLFEKLMVTICALREMQLTSFSIPDDETIGQSLAQLLEKNWQSLVHTASDQEESPTVLVKKILYSHQ